MIRLATPTDAVAMLAIYAPISEILLSPLKLVKPALPTLQQDTFFSRQLAVVGL
jgi:hypothetical protein